MAAGRRAALLTWRHFTQAMIHQFEPITDVEEAGKQLRALRQISRVGGYIQKFQELKYHLPNMLAKEAFHAFLFGLTPHLQEHTHTRPFPVPPISVPDLPSLYGLCILVRDLFLKQFKPTDAS